MMTTTTTTTPEKIPEASGYVAISAVVMQGDYLPSGQDAEAVATLERLGFVEAPQSLGMWWGYWYHPAQDDVVGEVEYDISTIRQVGTVGVRFFVGAPAKQWRASILRAMKSRDVSAD